MKLALEGVKPGDKLKVKRTDGVGYDVHVVERATKTQAVCESASFKIDTGLKIGSGDSYRRRHASFCTDEQYAQSMLDARIRDAQDTLRRFVVSPENVAAVEALLAPKPHQEGA